MLTNKEQNWLPAIAETWSSMPQYDASSDVSHATKQENVIDCEPCFTHSASAPSSCNPSYLHNNKFNNQIIYKLLDTTPNRSVLVVDRDVLFDFYFFHYSKV